MAQARPKLIYFPIAAAVLAIAGCKPAQVADAPADRRVVAVAKALPAQGVTGRYTGVVAARVQSGLGFRISGKITERLVDTGQIVKEGQPLMRIDVTDYAHAVAARAGDVAAARAKWTQASADERRYRGLVASGAISGSAYDQIKASAEAAKALLAAAEAQADVARNQAQYALLLADSDGTVIQTLAEPGQVVGAGQIVVRLAHAGPREVVVNLPETVRPEIGSVAQASLYNGSLTVGAKLRQLSDAADPATRTYEARFVMQGAGATAPIGATATLALAGATVSTMTEVPLGAIDDRGQGPGIWLVDPATSKVRRLSVKVAELGGDWAQVSEGITAGETVVAMGGHLLHEGEQVRQTDGKVAMK